MTDQSIDYEPELVPQQYAVQVFGSTTGDAVFERDHQDWERQIGVSKEVRIVVPRHYIPALIERLKLILAEGN